MLRGWSPLLLALYWLRWLRQPPPAFSAGGLQQTGIDQNSRSSRPDRSAGSGL